MTTKDMEVGEDLLKNALADLERHIIVSALKRCNGNQSMAARQLGTTKRMLAYRVRKYGIDCEHLEDEIFQQQGASPGGPVPPGEDPGKG